MQRFVTVKDKKKALTIFSYGLPEYELKLDGKGTVALTLLRCVGLLAGEHLITRPGGKGGWHNETPDAQCQGTYTFRYAVLPHSASEPASSDLLNEMSEYFHLPLLSIRRKNPSELPLSGNMLQMTSSQLVFSALKEAERGDGVVLRVYNTSDVEAVDTVHFTRKVRSASQALLNEEPLQRLTVTGDHDVPIRVPPFAVMTLKIELE